LIGEVLVKNLEKIGCKADNVINGCHK